MSYSNTMDRFMFGGGFFFIFFAVFFLIIAVFLVILIKGVSEWNKNNHSPRLAVQAKVVSKRQNVRRHHHGGAHRHSSTSTSYYVTFEFESQDRLELHVSSQEYGYLVEGDTGTLTFQGTRYISFERSL